VRILLLQNMLYVPALGGANKGNRELMERLAADGHRCTVVAPAQSPHGPQSREQVLAELTKRNLQPTDSSDVAEVFSINNVEVHALHDPKKISEYLRNLASTQFDCILVGADDPTQIMLERALEIAPGRVAFIARTTFYLPFGPVAALASASRARDIARTRAIICNSGYVADYVRKHLPKTEGSAPEIISLPLPVMGLKPRESPTRPAPQTGFVTLINPCAIKGTSIFLELARRLPDVPFAAVPTWGTTAEDRQALAALPNITILPATEKIDSIYAQTRVLLMPSLWDEAFGRAVVEAMLHAIPVLASDVGGLREAKLGTDYLLPVSEIKSYQNRYDEHHLPIPNVPAQDIAPWEKALREILTNQPRYEDLAQKSRAAAIDFVAKARFSDFEAILQRIASGPARNGNHKSALVEQLTPAQRTALALKALQAKKKIGANSDGKPNGSESRIAEIWRPLLKVRAVNSHDNFFDLGGHSLLAISMLTKLNQAFSIEIPLGAFLENPTVAGLARTIERQKNGAAAQKTIVLLREGTAPEPLFLVHAHNGRALVYMPLARAIATDRPIYGFEPHSQSSRRDHTSIESIAAGYVADLKEKQPSGPYHIAGQCFGGLLAYEMARQLAEAGDDVAFLGIIGAAAPGVLQEFANRNIASRIISTALARTHSEFNILFYSRRSDVLNRYRLRLNRAGEWVEHRVQRLRGNGAAGEKENHINETYRQATLTYRPKKYPGNLTLFRAQTQLMGSGRHTTLGWGSLVDGSLNVHTLPGPNTILLREPNLSHVARLISDLLRVPATARRSLQTH
jgi:thioesterase domain-containing protein/glycosyltransferase involved in cell wall biosynthesis/acyl carrier protein